VTIDPTIVVAPTPSTAANTMILADSATTTTATSWRLSVGTTPRRGSDADQVPLSRIPSGTTVASADLKLYYDQTFTTDANTVPMQALQANGLEPDDATWSNAGSIGDQWREREHDGARCGCVGRLPVASAVQSWVNGGANNGFVLKATKSRRWARAVRVSRVRLRVRRRGRQLPEAGRHYGVPASR